MILLIRMVIVSLHLIETKEALFFGLAEFLFDFSIVARDRQLYMGPSMHSHNTVQKLKVNI